MSSPACGRGWRSAANSFYVSAFAEGMLAAGCFGSAVTATGDSAIAARRAANKLIDHSSASPTAAISKVSDRCIVVSLYLTLFDNPQTACVPFGDRSVRVQRVRVCSASAGANRQSYFLICSSAFRFPPVLVSYHFIESAKETVQDVGSSTEPRRAISYSPFPAELGTSPVSQDFTFSTATVPLSEAEVDTVGPLAHIRQNLEIDNLRLSDFEVRPAAVSPYQVGLGKTVSALTSTDAPGRSRSTRWVSTPPPFRYPYFSRTRFKEIFAVSFPPSPPRLTCL